MKRVWITAFAASLILSALVDFLSQNGEEHGGLLGFHMLGLFALFGFIACVAIVVISKLIGHYWLQRKEDYYDRKNDDK